EVQRFGPLPGPADEDEDVPREQALLHRAFDQRGQGVVRLAHVHRLPVDEHANVLHRAEDHDILRSSAARVSTSRPSTTRPLGACATRRHLPAAGTLVTADVGEVGLATTGGTSTMRNRGTRAPLFGATRARRFLSAAATVSLPTSRSQRHNVLS